MKKTFICAVAIFLAMITLATCSPAETTDDEETPVEEIIIDTSTPVPSAVEKLSASVPMTVQTVELKSLTVETPEPLPEPEDITDELNEPEDIAAVEEEPESADISDVSEEDIELLALLTMAEAEGEPEEGQRLVIDTVLNRVDLGREFPDNIHDVIYQKYHFESVWNGRMKRCYIMESIEKLVREELVERTNYDVIYFNAGDYSIYGVPMFKVGNHYFSSYE